MDRDYEYPRYPGEFGNHEHYNRLVFICSPYRPESDNPAEQSRELLRNIKLAKIGCKIAVGRGCAPFAPHLLYPQFLNDHDKESREAGMKIGLQFLHLCDEMWVLGRKITEGMAAEIEAANEDANTNVSMLGESFKYCAPVAGSLGMSAEDTAVALGLMANSGIKASQAGTELRTGLTNLAKPTKQMQTYMDKYGISLTDSSGNMLSMRELMVSLREKMGGLSEAEQAATASAIFGKNSMAGWLAIINASDEDFDKLCSSIDTCTMSYDRFSEAMEGVGRDAGELKDSVKSLGITQEEFDQALIDSNGDAEAFMQALEGAVDAGVSYDQIAEAMGLTTEELQAIFDSTKGSAEEMADIMQDNLSGQLTILKSQLEELAISFGEILMPTIRAIVTKIQAFVDKLNNMSDAQKQTIVKIAALAAAIDPLLVVLGTVISKVGTAMKAFASFGKGLVSVASKVKSAGGVMGVLKKAIAALTSPIGIVIAVIAVLVAAFVHLWQTNEEFRNKVTAIWEGIKAKFQAFGKAITERLSALGFDFKNITEVLKAVWDGFCQVLAPVFEAAFEVVSTVLGTVLDVLIGLFDVFSNLF